jgi:hypothetical protein
LSNESASSSNPTCVPSQREYRTFEAFGRRITVRGYARFAETAPGRRGCPA